GVTDKILFGSDYPLLPPNRYFRDLNRSELTEEEKAAILGGNAKRLLKIKP
ncbi:MAG: amidohydrolase family protein, partial [Clostridiaceae bacterium]|nr:amidohydrolase family protein [Clostridiaceae bacterium]